jgi:hypothetical protein
LNKEEENERDVKNQDENSSSAFSDRVALAQELFGATKGLQYLRASFEKDGNVCVAIYGTSRKSQST